MRGYLHVFETNDPAAMQVEDEFNALTANVDAIEAIYQQDQASDLTEVIADLDIQRDQYLIGMGSVVSGYRKHYDAGMVQMAKKLMHHIDDVYGSAYGIGKQTLPQQTATVDNLVYDLQNDPELSAAVTAFHLTDWVGQLQMVNDNLRGAYHDRTTEQGAAPSDKIKDLRIAGNELYYQLRQMLMAQAHVSGYIAPYETVINETNALANTYNNILDRRSGGSDVDPEDDGGDNDVGQE